MATTTSTDMISQILNAVVTLGGLIGPGIGKHAQATQQINQLLTQLESEVSQGDWSQVLLTANTIRGIQGISDAALNMVASIIKSAENAQAVTGTMSGATAVQIAQMNVSNQQLILTNVQNLRRQLTDENGSIFSHLMHINRIVSASTPTA